MGTLIIANGGGGGAQETAARWINRSSGGGGGGGQVTGRQRHVRQGNNEEREMVQMMRFCRWCGGEPMEQNCRNNLDRRNRRSRLKLYNFRCFCDLCRWGRGRRYMCGGTGVQAHRRRRNGSNGAVAEPQEL